MNVMEIGFALIGTDGEFVFAGVSDESRILTFPFGLCLFLWVDDSEELFV